MGRFEAELLRFALGLRAVMFFGKMQKLDHNFEMQIVAQSDSMGRAVVKDENHPDISIL